MSEDPNVTVKLPRGQSSLRSRLLRALQEGWNAPPGSRHPVYRLRDGKAIRKSSAHRLAEQLDLWEAAKPSKQVVAVAGAVGLLDGEDKELVAISLMLNLDSEARKRVLSYIESRS